MDSLVKASIIFYENYLQWMSVADKRVEKWMFMSSPLPTIAWDLLYIAVVLIGLQGHLSFPRLRCWGPLVIVHNMAMIALNGYVCIYLYILTARANYNYQCQPLDQSDDPTELKIAEVLWWVYISKLLEFMDTVLFIVKGNLHQVSFLHVYHHISMFSIWWIGVKWVPGGSPFLGAMINAGVHVIMYGYYLAAALRPGRRLWWKKLVTVLQLGQFILIVCQVINGLYVECPFPRFMGYTLVGLGISLILLFGNFWSKAYGSKLKPS